MKSVAHSNNIGFLRLLFASLVIVAHAPAIIDGNSSREFLSNLIGSRTLGDLSVDGFFLISGYLIVKSYERSSSTISYLKKRILRIYPGFIAAVLVCIMLAPLTGAVLRLDSVSQAMRFIVTVLALQPAPFNGFTGLPYNTLNGSLWTISYEFRCYIFALAVGWMGLVARRRWFAAMSIALVALTTLPLPTTINGAVAFFIGYPSDMARFLSAFSVGACFYLYRDRIALRGDIAAGCAAMLLILMATEVFEVAAFAVFGGYLIFWFAFAVQSSTISRINSDDDVSYGVYLYGWPISSCLLYFFGVSSPALMIVLTLPLAYIAGYFSWVYIERRFTRSRTLHDTSVPNPVS